MLLGTPNQLDPVYLSTCDGELDVGSALVKAAVLLAAVVVAVVRLLFVGQPYVPMGSR